MARRWSYQSKTEVYNAPRLPVTPSQTGWYVPWTAPVLRQYPLNVAEAWTPTSLPFQNPPIGWLVPFADPPRPASRPTEWYFIWDPQTITQTVVAPPAFGWYVEWPDPVRSVPRFTDANLLWDPQPIIMTVTPDQMGWYGQWADPVRNRASSDGSTSWAVTSLPFQNPPFGWYTPFAPPTLAALKATDSWFIWDPRTFPKPTGQIIWLQGPF